MLDEFGPAIASFDPCEGMRAPRKRRSSGIPQGERSPKKKQSAFSRIIRLCTVRDRSRRELEERLIKENYPPHEIEDALDRAVDCNLVDDMRFADAYIRARISSGKGLRGIEFDLSKHGIEAESIEGWPYSYGLGEDEQLMRALGFLETHPPRCKDVRSGAYRKLVSKGYSSSIASEAAKMWMEESRSHSD